MPYGTVNPLVKGMACQVLTMVDSTSVLEVVCDDPRACSGALRAAGNSRKWASRNLPNVELIVGLFRASLEGTDMGFEADGPGGCVRIVSWGAHRHACGCCIHPEPVPGDWRTLRGQVDGTSADGSGHRPADSQLQGIDAGLPVMRNDAAGFSDQVDLEA